MADQLDTILQQAFQLLRRGSHDQALAILEPLAQQALALYQDEMHPSMAKYYYALGTTILAKIESNNEIFGADIKAKVDDKEQPKEVVKEEQGKEEKMEEKEEQEGDESEGPQEEVDDIQVAWENLEVARQIYHKESLKESPEQSILHELARVHMRLGDLEMWREAYTQSSEEYRQSLAIREKYQDPSLSRDIAEIYFTLSNLAQYQGEQNAEEVALQHLLKSKDILHKNLQQQQGQEGTQDRMDVELKQGDTDEVAELKGILQDLYQKVDDLQLVIRQKGLVAQAIQPVQTGFKPTDEKKEVINLGVMGNARKKQKVEQSKEDGVQL